MDREVLAKYCKDKQVPEQTRSHLSSLSEEDLTAIVCLIEGLSPSSNSLRTFFDLLGDIQHRDKLSFSQILDKVSLSLILSSSGSSKDKQVNLKNSLLRIRFPEKFAIEDRLNDLIASIKETFGLKIILPEELEGDQLQINFAFRATQNLKSFSEKLVELSESKQLQEIFSLLKGEV